MATQSSGHGTHLYHPGSRRCSQRLVAARSNSLLLAQTCRTWDAYLRATDLGFVFCTPVQMTGRYLGWHDAVPLTLLRGSRNIRACTGCVRWAARFAVGTTVITARARASVRIPAGDFGAKLRAIGSLQFGWRSL